jgi:hypothetical protein
MRRIALLAILMAFYIGCATTRILQPSKVPLEFEMKYYQGGVVPVTREIVHIYSDNVIVLYNQGKIYSAHITPQERERLHALYSEESVLDVMRKQKGRQHGESDCLVFKISNDKELETVFCCALDLPLELQPYLDKLDKAFSLIFPGKYTSCESFMSGQGRL